MPGNKISKALENDSFAISIMHLRLRRKDYMKVVERKIAIEL